MVILYTKTPTLGVSSLPIFSYSQLREGIFLLLLIKKARTNSTKGKNISNRSQFSAPAKYSVGNKNAQPLIINCLLEDFHRPNTNNTEATESNTQKITPTKKKSIFPPLDYHCIIHNNIRKR